MEKFRQAVERYLSADTLSLHSAPSSVTLRVAREWGIGILFYIHLWYKKFHNNHHNFRKYRLCQPRVRNVGLRKKTAAKSVITRLVNEQATATGAIAARTEILEVLAEFTKIPTRSDSTAHRNTSCGIKEVLIPSCVQRGNFLSPSSPSLPSLPSFPICSKYYEQTQISMR